MLRNRQHTRGTHAKTQAVGTQDAATQGEKAMKAGYKVFDSDAHVSEPPEAIDAYVDSAYKSALDKLKLPGIKTYRPNQIGFQRRLGAKRSADDAKPKAAQPTQG